MISTFWVKNPKTRLRVVCNIGDGDCGVGEIHTRTPVASLLLEISPAPLSPSRKLETTLSLLRTLPVQEMLLEHQKQIIKRISWRENTPSDGSFSETQYPRKEL